MVIVCFLAGTSADADLWGHLRFGRDILHARSVHASDPYSFTSDRPWINHEWLAELLMWLAYSARGAAGLVALKLLLACGAGAALLATWRAHAFSAPWRDALLFLTALGTWPVLATMRPQAFSVLLFALLLLAMDRIRNGSARWLLALPVLFAVWVNVHGGWIVGAGTLGIYVAGAWWRGTGTLRERVMLTAAACCALVATLVNPYGLAMVSFLAETVRPERADIIEWRPATAVPLAGFLLWLVPTAVAAVGLWRGRRSIGSDAALIVLLLGLGSFRVIRLVGFYALAVGFMVAPCIAEGTSPARPAPARRIERFRAALLAVALILIAVASFGRRIAMNGDWLPEREAAVFIQAHGLHGRMLTWFDYGEFAIWYFSPSIRVSMDGRRETVYSDDMRERHLRIYDNAPDALDQVARLDPDFIWLPTGCAVIGRLETAGWKPLFSGSRSVVLGRTSSIGLARETSPGTPGPRSFPGP